MRPKSHCFSVKNCFKRFDIKPTSKTDINIQVKVCYLHVLRLNIESNHLSRKTTNQCLLQVAERNEDGLL